MSKGFRVTVEDLDTGEKQAMEVAAGDFMLIPFAPCFLEHTQMHPAAGTVVLTLKNHRPQGDPRVVPGEQVAGSPGTA